jgi:hypothetical protein
MVEWSRDVSTSICCARRARPATPLPMCSARRSRNQTAKPEPRLRRAAFSAQRSAFSPGLSAPGHRRQCRGSGLGRRFGFLNARQELRPQRLKNARHHGAWIPEECPDPRSSGRFFDGWLDFAAQLIPGLFLPVAAARTWLLSAVEPQQKTAEPEPRLRRAAFSDQRSALSPGLSAPGHRRQCRGSGLGMRLRFLNAGQHLRA